MARALVLLQGEEAALAQVEGKLRTFVEDDAYIPERIRRSLETELNGIAREGLPRMEKVLRRTRAAEAAKHFEEVSRRGAELYQTLQNHNAMWVRGAIGAHRHLLQEELHLDEAQQLATVRDDERNLVIAGAGSGKTRTLIARIRFLLECGVPPAAIVAVTFTNKATEEMEDRLQQMQVPTAEGGRGGVTVSTLHALGKRVVQASLRGPLSVADDEWVDSLVAAALRDARTAADAELAQLYVNAVLYFHRNEDERAPASANDLGYRTLRGEHVRSLGERIIADFLLTNHVPYRYEARAEWADVGAGRDAYHPDFTLPDTGICIEYWGIDRSGSVPRGWTTSSAEYRHGMEWKRQQFRDRGKTLVEFYDYERTEGTLEGALQERLSRAGVTMRPMALEELEPVLGDLKYIGSAIEQLLVQFVSNARSLRLKPDEIRSRLGRASPRVRHFGLLGIAVLRQYEARLAEEGRIDFSDMLHRAADELEAGTNPLPRFQHVLVDEFQDTSAAMARFLKALLAADQARLFAVGDDWQAIYGFAGGDVDHIVHFEKHFGPASTTMMSVNYRSPAVIAEAGSALIAHNRNQIPKQIVVSSPNRGEAFLHEVPDDDAELVGATIRLIQQERQRCKPEDILVLSRTNHLLEPITDACKRNRIPLANPLRDLPGVRVLSGHKAKGLEAPVVIVINASDHLLGFPCKVENPDVLEPVRMSAGDGAAEERRLFYVAITRTMSRLHLVARRGLPSPYIAEIENVSSVARSGAHQLDPSRIHVGNRFSAPFHVERLYTLSQKQVAAGIRQSGMLAMTGGRFAFTSWAPFDLQEGGAYIIAGAMKERPYRGQQRLKLDSRTIAHVAGAPATEQPAGMRPLHPRPPQGMEPRMLYP